MQPTQMYYFLIYSKHELSNTSSILILDYGTPIFLSSNTCSYIIYSKLYREYLGV